MRPSQCRKGMRVYVNVLLGGVLAGYKNGTAHGEIVQVLIDDTAVTNRVRRVLVRWDGAVMPTEVDPVDLRRETPAPVHDPVKLERWLDS